jgi:hypothetical protein
MTHYTRIWNKPWPELGRTYNETRSSLNGSPDHPEQSKPFRRWKQPSQCSIETTRTQNTKFQNMPLETDAGNAHPVFIRCPSRTYSNMTSRINTTKIKSLGTKWRRFFNKIQTSPTKFPIPIKHLRRNSRRTQSWLWLPRRWPPTCSSGTTKAIKRTPKQRISPHGQNHFLKRSESESYINKSESKNSKSESESENTDTKTKSESKDIMTVTIDAITKELKEHQHNVTARADKVKTIKEQKNEIRIKIGKQLDKGRKSLALTEPDLQFSSHLHLATAFTIFILIFILIFNYFLFDHFDHHFQTSTFKDLRDCKKHCSLQIKAWHWAEISATKLAIPESTKSPRNPENQLDLLAKDLLRNLLIPITLRSKGLLRNSESNIQMDSFIITYLGSPR